MSLRSIILATVAACAYVADAHMIMKQPVPFAVDKIDNGPINKEQWPCKHQLGYTISEMNKMAVGQEQDLFISGGAPHGGGGCQLAVTTDTEPTATSKWKVIMTIEGGCPNPDAGDDDSKKKFKFSLPDSVPNGKATFAWTWFAKLSGGPEMYMNCAPIEVSGGASDTSKFDALPDMLVANLAQVTDCKQVPSTDMEFPNPGQNVLKAGTPNLQPPTGSCGASGSSPAPSGGASAPASSAAGGQPSAAPSSAGGNDGMYTPPAGAAPTSAAATSAAATSAAGYPTSAAGGAPAASKPVASSPVATAPAASGAPGGVFAPGASSAAPVASTQTTLVTVTGTPSTPSKTTAVASKPAATTPAAGTGGAGAAPTSAPAVGGSSSGTCSTNGAVVCNGPTQFGLCDNGKVVFMPVAAGTTCSNGTIQKRGYHGRVVRRNRGLVGHVHKH